MTKEKCSKCKKKLKSGLQCDVCKQWTHKYCDKRKFVLSPDGGYVCKNCHEEVKSKDKFPDMNSEETVDSINTKEGELLNNPTSTSTQPDEKISTPLSTVTSMQSQILNLEQQLASKDNIIDLLLTDIEALKAELAAVKSKLSKPDPNRAPNLKSQQPLDILADTRSSRVFNSDQNVITSEEMETPEQRDVINIPTHNKFSAFADYMERDETNTNLLFQGEKDCTKSRSKGQHRILIVGDSHAKSLGLELTDRLEENFSVTGIIRANAPLQHITSDLDQLAQEFTEDDCVVVIGGTNDELNNQCFLDSLQSASEKISQVSETTNIIVLAIPERYDIPDSNDGISAANSYGCKIMRDTVKAKGNCDNFLISSAMCKLDRKLYTKHGLHFNMRGKSIIGKRLTSQVRAILCKNFSSETITTDCNNNTQIFPKESLNVRDT